MKGSIKKPVASLKKPMIGFFDEAYENFYEETCFHEETHEKSHLLFFLWSKDQFEIHMDMPKASQGDFVDELRHEWTDYAIWNSGFAFRECTFFVKYHQVHYDNWNDFKHEYLRTHGWRKINCEWRRGRECCRTHIGHPGEQRQLFCEA